MHIRRGRISLDRVYDSYAALWYVCLRLVHSPSNQFPFVLTLRSGGLTATTIDSMSLFNLLAPGFATFYKHPNFSSADDVIPDLKGKVAIVTGGTGESPGLLNENSIVPNTKSFSKVVWA